MRAEATMMSGRMLDAAELFEWSGIYARSAEPPITGFAQAMKSICLLHAGHPAEESLAIVRGPNGIRLVRDNPTKLQLYVCLGALIECHRLDGDYAAAMKAADEALGLAESGDDCNSFMTGYNAHSALAGLFLDLLGKRLAGEKLDASVPDQAGLETYVRRALAQLTAGRKLFPAVRTRELLHTGQFERLRGSSSRARRAWTEALEVSTRMTMPWEEAATCIELAGISEGSERKQWAARAQEVASASSLARLSERARALG
jgi:hypothetical protein